MAEGLTASEADAALAEAAVPAEERRALAKLLEAIESAEYGSGVATEIPAMIEEAQRTHFAPGAAPGTERSSRVMRRVFATVIVLVFTLAGDALAAAPPGERQRTFIRALEIFDAAKTKQDYRESAAVLESLLVNGFRNGAVYYNLGNAYFRAGEYGRAIAAYRKAKPYRPRDPNLEANLRQALSVAPGHLPEPPPPLWTHVLFWSGWLSFPEKAYAALGGYLLAALVACAAMFLRRGRLYWASAALVICAIVLTLDAGLAYADIAWSRQGVVTTETIARKGIGKDYEPAFNQPLKDGAEFTILSETGDWIFGHFEGIGDGWLRREHTAR